MAKQSRRSQLSQSKNHQGHIIEEVFDDNLLPDSSEIKKLSELDPNIIQWLKERAEKEQDFRHKTFTTRIRLVSKSERGTRWINYLGLLCSFFLLGGGMYLSYTLISVCTKSHVFDKKVPSLTVKPIFHWFFNLKTH